MCQRNLKERTPESSRSAVNCLAIATVKPAIVDLSLYMTFVVVSLEVHHTMNETLLLGVLRAPSSEHKMWCRNAGIVLSDHRVLPFP